MDMERVVLEAVSSVAGELIGKVFFRGAVRQVLRPRAALLVPEVIAKALQGACGAVGAVVMAVAADTMAAAQGQEAGQEGQALRPQRAYSKTTFKGTPGATAMASHPSLLQRRRPLLPCLPGQ